MSALDFDAHAALAEIGIGKGLRAKGANHAKVSTVLPCQTENLATLAPLAVSPSQLPTCYLDWSAALAALDVTQPISGRQPKDWHALVEDARWLADTHGSKAAGLGWTASDLFGLWPEKPGWGGIADRLNGARTLVLDASRASWRSWGELEQFNRGSYPELPLLWAAT